MSLIKKMEETTAELLNFINKFDETIQSLNSTLLDLFTTEQQFMIRSRTMNIEKNLQNLNRLLKGKINSKYGKPYKYFGGKVKSEIFPFSNSNKIIYSDTDSIIESKK